MRQITKTDLISRFPDGYPAGRIFEDIANAIAAVCWPPGACTFTIHPQSGKKRDEGNGVKPIKEAFIAYLSSQGWVSEEAYPTADSSNRPPGPFDSFLALDKYKPFVVEWETGNVSSSHRSLNKMSMALLDKHISGGVLVVPTKAMAKWLTDRVGNYEELSPYFRFWSATPADGYLGVIAVEHDAESFDVPRIAKGTDGRALI